MQVCGNEIATQLCEWLLEYSINMMARGKLMVSMSVM